MEGLKIMEGINSLIIKYERSSILRALVQLIPMGVGSALDTGIMTHVNNIRADRLKILFLKLESIEAVLTEQDIQNEDFLHAYFITTRAVVNTRRREKIELLARLFTTFVHSKKFAEIDDYEEMLDILDDVHYREFKILLILQKFEEKNPIQEGQNGLQRSWTFWSDFIKEVEEQFKIDKIEINACLSRINRTGLYQPFIGGFHGYSGDQGYLTPLFYKLLNKLRNQ